MPISTYSHVGISAICSAVPKTRIENISYQQDVFGVEHAQGVIDTVGIKQRRFACDDMTPSDLGYHAVSELLEKLDIDRESIDVLIFVSELPDFKFPHTASTLQHRLGLTKNLMAFDMPTGCSGSIYALSVAFALLQANTGLKRALVVFAETPSRFFSPQDQSTAFLFGDGASCVLVESGEQFSDSYFSIMTDGGKADLIKHPAGGARSPLFNAGDYGAMDGGGVFQFVIAEVPKNIKGLLQSANKSMTDVDYAVFHQANLFIIKHLAKKFKLNPEQVPTTIERFGNMSSASLLVTISECLTDHISTEKGSQVILSAFGTGMSCGSALLHMSNCRVLPLIEV